MPARVSRAVWRLEQAELERAGQAAGPAEATRPCPTGRGGGSRRGVAGYPAAAVFELTGGDEDAAELLVPALVNEMVCAVLAQFTVMTRMQADLGVVFPHPTELEGFTYTRGCFTDDYYAAAGWGEQPPPVGHVELAALLLHGHLVSRFPHWHQESTGRVGIWWAGSGGVGAGTAAARRGWVPPGRVVG